MKLSNKTLQDLPNSVIVPHYDRTQLSAGIVHIGVGNFHRAHQAWYLHKLMQEGKALDWAIIGAGVRAADAVMREKLLEQDCLVTLIELDPAAHNTVEISGSMIDFLPVQEDNAALIETMSQPNIRIVSLTVTESGYYYDPETGKLDINHPDIQHDAAHPDTPRTAFGAMISALKLRRDAGHAAFTAQSCDNIQGNGDILREVLCGLATLSDPDLAAWIGTNSAFPNAMVDCIVPATGDKERAIAKKIGIDDDAPVTHENYHQWVIEDKFCAGRPEWEDVGVTITPSVHDYEAMKLRILNGGHQILANAGEMLGIETISGSMAHPVIADYFAKVQEEEIAPYVAPVPNMTPKNYIKLITTRLLNPVIYDTTRRVCFDGSSRHPGFVLPILRDALEQGGSVQGLALAEALWSKMCAGVRDDGSVIKDNDPHWDVLSENAHAAKTNPQIWLDQNTIYGSLAENEIFAQSFVYWLKMLWDTNVEKTLEHYINNKTK